MITKKWTKPVLLVLIRGKPQEYILQDCKTKTGAEGALKLTGWCGDKECGTCVVVAAY